jgi:hypothetical protein
MEVENGLRSRWGKYDGNSTLAHLMIHSEHPEVDPRHRRKELVDHCVRSFMLAFSV